MAGIALAAFAQGAPLAGFMGPWRATAGGVDIVYTILGYETTTRQKHVTEVIASIPDGSSLAQIRSISTTAIVDACAEAGITVARGAVLLPSMQAGL